jgi:hypothetical protein
MFRLWFKHALLPAIIIAALVFLVLEIATHSATGSYELGGESLLTIVVTFIICAIYGTFFKKWWEMSRLMLR